MIRKPAVHIAPGHFEVKHKRIRSEQRLTNAFNSQDWPTDRSTSQRGSTDVIGIPHSSTTVGVACMKCRRIIGERHRYWNIKGCSRFAVSFWLNYLYFLRFPWCHFEEIVAPTRYHS